jgi:hypothetical protein
MVLTTRPPVAKVKLTAIAVARGHERTNVPR